MRATLFLLISFLVFGLFLWIVFGAASLLWGVFFTVFGLVFSFGYTDTAILFFLGAREVRSGDESSFFEAAAQEAYKLAVPLPQLYFYNGSLERAFVLQNKGKISLVLSRSLLEQSQPSELSAICFELLLQVKKGLATKRTKVMFILGIISWFFHSFARLLSNLIPVKELNKAIGWIFNYFLYPWLEFIFVLLLGRGYFRKLENHLSEYAHEKECLRRVGLKLRKPAEIYSLPSKKLLEFSSAWRSSTFQTILSLELLPHEWDFFFNSQELISAEEH